MDCYSRTWQIDAFLSAVCNCLFNVFTAAFLMWKLSRWICEVITSWHSKRRFRMLIKFLLMQDIIDKTHSKAAFSSCSRVGCEKLVCLSSPLRTSTNHHHTVTPHNCLVHYNEAWHLSDHASAIRSLGGCMLQQKFNAQTVKNTDTTAKASRVGWGKNDYLWRTG